MVVVGLGRGQRGKGMIELHAGQYPHIITRPCTDRDEVERWARALIQLGFVPVTINGELWHPVGEEAQAKAALTVI